MRFTTRRTVAVALSTLALSTLALSTLAPGMAVAHEDATRETEATAVLRSTPFATNTYGPGVVSGEAQLEEEDGRLEIEAEVQGLKPGTTHVGHIHLGDCTRLFPGEIIYDLEPITIGRDGEGRSVTVVDDTTGASLAAVSDCRWWVAFHEGPANSSPQSPAVAIGAVLIEQG